MSLSSHLDALLKHLSVAYTLYTDGYAEPSLIPLTVIF